MNRRCFLEKTVLPSAVILAANTLSAKEPSTERPNILFIATDQQTASALYCAGNPYVKTSYLDALAERGIYFKKSFCTNPLSIPSRASWLTSRMTHEIDINDNPTSKYPVRFPKDIPLTGKLFRVAGYETAYVGKWHVPVPYPGMNKGSIPGFDVLPLVGEFRKILGDRGAMSGLSVDHSVIEAAVEFLSKPHNNRFCLQCRFLICMYEESVAVPFFIAGPGIKPTIDNTNLVSGIDILPILLDYAGIDISKSLAGRSLRPVIEGKNPACREYIVAESGQDANIRMVRSLRYKYIVYAEGDNPEQFFDCQFDPGEANNLITDLSMKSAVNQP